MSVLPFPHLFLVPVLGFVPSAGGHVGILILDSFDNLIHVQRAFAVITYDHCLILDLRLHLLDLLQGGADSLFNAFSSFPTTFDDPLSCTAEVANF